VFQITRLSPKAWCNAFTIGNTNSYSTMCFQVLTFFFFSITSQGIDKKTRSQMMGTSSDFRLKDGPCVKPDRPPAASAEAPLYAFSLGTVETGLCRKDTGDISAAVWRCGPLSYLLISPITTSSDDMF
jgi:hypothetical protein